MIIKILGYHTLIFLLVRFKGRIQSHLRKEDEKIKHIIATTLVYLPMIIFVVCQLIKLGLRF